MKDSIYTIPISEVFEPKCGCPICALHKTLEERWVEYITGAAMMEPDIRIETNRHGFCEQHFEMMLGQRNRLSVALMLQTRLAWIDGTLEIPARPAGLLRGDPKADGTDECFVCSRIGAEFRRIGSNIASVWGKEPDFRALYREQEFLCYPHAKVLLAAGQAALRGRALSEFRTVTVELARKRLCPLKADIDTFCNLFDYRNAGGPQPGGNVATAIERSIAFLTARPDPGAKP